jgi:hypothetical protein
MKKSSGKNLTLDVMMREPSQWSRHFHAYSRTKKEQDDLLRTILKVTFLEDWDQSPTRYAVEIFGNMPETAFVRSISLTLDQLESNGSKKCYATGKFISGWLSQAESHQRLGLFSDADIKRLNAICATSIQKVPDDSISDFEIQHIPCVDRRFASVAAYAFHGSQISSMSDAWNPDPDHRRIMLKRCSPHDRIVRKSSFGGDDFRAASALLACMDRTTLFYGGLDVSHTDGGRRWSEWSQKSCLEILGNGDDDALYLRDMLLTGGLTKADLIEWISSSCAHEPHFLSALAVLAD